MKGTYILLIELGSDRFIKIGSLGKIRFSKGLYAYVGSGMNSLEMRIARHLKRRGKKKFWHIDYFLADGRISKAVLWESAKKDECKVAEMLAERFQDIEHFGCSDCGCKSHLFYSGKSGPMEKAALEISRSFQAPQPLRSRGTRPFSTSRT